MKNYSIHLCLGILFILLNSLSEVCIAQAPPLMSFQAVLRNADGTLHASSDVGMRISILQGSPEGSAVYEETHSVITNAHGLMSLAIGSGEVSIGSISSINWTLGPYYFQVETDLEGGSNYSIQSVNEFSSVPFALHAAVAENSIQPIVEYDTQFQLSPSASIVSEDTLQWNAKIEPVAAGDGIALTGNVISSNSTHWIGELYQGGMIVALWSENGEQHGLISAVATIGYYAYSNVTGIFIGSSAWNSMDGQQNSAAILAQPGHAQSAASACYGYADGTWYLPSVLELKEVFRQRFLFENSGFQFPDAYYWTSTEYSGTDIGSTALAIQNFQLFDGKITPLAKYNTVLVLPVKRF